MLLALGVGKVRPLICVKRQAQTTLELTWNTNPSPENLTPKP